MVENMKKNLVVVGGIIAAVIVGAGIITYLLTGTSSEPPSVASPDETTPQIDNQSFDLRVLQRAGYKALDQRPVQDGLLPVKPPQLPGKANPFF